MFKVNDKSVFIVFFSLKVCSGICLVNFEHISYFIFLFLVLLLLTLNR